MTTRWKRLTALMLILLACMTAVKYVTARYVYGGDEE